MTEMSPSNSKKICYDSCKMLEFMNDYYCMFEMSPSNSKKICYDSCKMLEFMTDYELDKYFIY